MFQSRTLKISLIIIVILAVAGAASALAAANTVPDTYAGDGSGYTQRTKAEVVAALGTAGCSVFIDATATYSSFYYTSLAVNGSIEQSLGQCTFPLLYQAMVP